MGIFRRLFGKRASKEVPLGSAKLGGGVEMRFTYDPGGGGKRIYGSCPNCGFRGGFSAVWTCHVCGFAFCTECLQKHNGCPKCKGGRLFQSGLIEVAR
jgi:hypothetical protein